MTLTPKLLVAVVIAVILVAYYASRPTVVPVITEAQRIADRHIPTAPRLTHKALWAIAHQRPTWAARFTSPKA